MELDSTAAWRALLLAHNRALRAIEHDMEQAGVIPLAWHDILLELSQAEKQQLRMQDLALKVVLSRTRVSRVVAELEAQGLVKRYADCTDGRVALATITPAGQAALDQAAPVYLAGIHQHFNRHLTDHQQQTIVCALQSVLKAHDACTNPRK